MPYLEFERWLLAAVLAMARTGAALSVCPPFADSMIPGIARRVVMFAFSFLAIPYILEGLPPGEPNLWAFGFVAVKEAFVGFLVGFFSAIPFWVAENVGNFIDNQRGATMGEVYSPLSGAQVSSTGIFFTQIVSTLFFVSGAVFLFIGALYSSYHFWPVFSEGVSLAKDAPVQILGALDEMLRLTVVISAPAIIVMFLATIGLGLVNRTAPQLNVFFLSMPIKSALGVAMLAIYLPFILDMLMYTNEGVIITPIRKLLVGA